MVSTYFPVGEPIVLKPLLAAPHPPSTSRSSMSGNVSQRDRFLRFRFRLPMPGTRRTTPNIGSPIANRAERFVRWLAMKPSPGAVTMVSTAFCRVAPKVNDAGWILAVAFAGSPTTDKDTGEFNGVPWGATRIENEIVCPALATFVAGEPAKVKPETAMLSVLVSFERLASVPPDTFAVVTRFAEALLATFTVNVIAG